MTARLRTRRRCLESAAERQYRRIQAPLRHHESPLRRALVVPQRNRAGGGGGPVGPFQTLGELHRSRARVAEWPVADPILRVLVLTQENATTKSHTRCASRRIGKTPAVPTGPGKRLTPKSEGRRQKAERLDPAAAPPSASGRKRSVGVSIPPDNSLCFGLPPRLLRARAVQSIPEYPAGQYLGNTWRSSPTSWM